MPKLTNPHTGHSVNADSDVDVEFWTAAGYAGAKSAKKAPAKKAAKKSSKK